MSFYSLYNDVPLESRESLKKFHVVSFWLLATPCHQRRLNIHAEIGQKIQGLSHCVDLLTEEGDGREKVGGGVKRCMENEKRTTAMERKERRRMQIQQGNRITVRMSMSVI